MSQHELSAPTQLTFAREVAAVLAEYASAQEDLAAAQTKMHHSQRRLAMLVRDLCVVDGAVKELMTWTANPEAPPADEATPPRSMKRQDVVARREEFLELYATTDLSQRRLAERFGYHADRPRQILHLAREAGDDRVRRGDERRAKSAAPQAATQGTCPEAQDEGRPENVRNASDECAALGGEAHTVQSEEFVAATGAGEAVAAAVDPVPAPDDPLPVDGLPKREPIIPITKPKPEPPPKPLVASTQLPLALETKAEPLAAPELPIDRVITVQGHLVIGPTGQWRTSPQIGKTLAILADGQLYGLDRMQRAGGWSEEKFVKAGLTAWTRELKEIGVDLIQLKGIGVRLARREIA